MKKNKKVIGLLFVVGALALTAGCAVMTIDVDVYKGPLANHEKVQMEQMAVMAIGAKPLLFQLREELERLVDAEFLSQPRAMPEYPFKNKDADRVDEILGLYDNLDPIDPRLKELIAQNEKALSQFLSSYRVFRPSVVVSSEKEWTELAAGLYGSLKPEKGRNLEEDHPANKGTPSQKWAEIKTGIHSLRNGYRFLIKADRPDKRADFIILQAHRKFFELLCDVDSNKALIKGINIMALLDNKSSVFDSSSNATFEALTRRDVLESHAELLFPETEKSKRLEFIRLVAAKANAFFECRKALNRLFESTLKGILLVNTNRIVSEKETFRITRESGGLVVELVDPVHLIGILNTIDSLSCNIAKPLKDFSITMKKELPGAFDQSNVNFWDPKKKPAKLRRYWKSKWLNEARIVLLEQIVSNPLVTSKALQEAHRLFIDTIAFKNPKVLQSSGLEERYKFFKARSFGLVVGPDYFSGQKGQAGGDKEGDGREEAKKIMEKFDYIIPLRARHSREAMSRGSLSGGRLEYGLEYLIEKYLEALDQKDLQELEKKLPYPRLRLINALVRFSEKVLFIANNSVLFKESGDSDKKKAEKYAMVLQAVGNSILIQADELRHREEHKRRLKNKGMAELWALERALSRDPGKVIDDLVRAISTDAREQADQHKMAEKEKKESTELVANAVESLKKTQAEHVKAKDGKEKAEVELKEVIESKKHITDAFKTVHGDEADEIRLAVTKNGQVDGQTMSGEIAELIKQKYDEYDESVKNGEDPKRLKNAYEFFQVPPPKVTAIAQDERDAVFRAILKIVKTNNTEARKQIAAAEEKAESTAIQLKEAEESLKVADQKNTEAASELLRAEAKEKSIRDAKRKLDNAVAVINERKGTVVAQAEAAGIGADPKSVISLMTSKLRDKLHELQGQSPASEDQEKAKLKDAIEELEKRKPTLEPLSVNMASLRQKKKLDSREVLDALIAALRHEHITEVSESGAGKGLAPQIKEAIEAAYAHRTGMVYIRPSGAYLRSSYPSTSLQEDPGLSWKNMLWRHSLRSIPLVGEDIVNRTGYENIRTRAEINAEIDKQFWQNINRVRVAGGGITNYVIAKDDIGNWYVKAYSADSGPIIKSAKNLALFNLGAHMNTDLLSRLKEKKGEEGAEEKTEAGSTRLERLYFKYEKEYKDRTKADREGLLKELKNNKLQEYIESAWKRNEKIGEGDKLKKLKGCLESAAGHLDKAEEGLSETSKDKRPAIQILETLQDIKMFFDELIVRIKDPKFIPESDKAEETKKKSWEEARTAAIKEAGMAEESFFKDMIGRRTDAVKDYETAVVFIGEATQQ